MTTSMKPAADWRTPTVVLVAGGLILTVGMGIRHGFGLFLQPMSADLHWGRETFALAIAVQNLMWGLTQPFAGMLADKYGAGRVLVGGALLYILGLVTMAHATTPLMMVLTAGVLIGTGLSGVTFSVVSGVLGRTYPPEKRSMALGVSAAMGSFGQFALLPLTQWLLSHVGWYGALLTLAGVGVLMIPLALALVEPKVSGKVHEFRQSAGEAMREALGYRSYVLLTLGFFVCGFQVVFIGVHLPSYLLDKGLTAQVGVYALMLVGFFNIVGTLITGWLGGRIGKRYILSASDLFRPQRRHHHIPARAAVTVGVGIRVAATFLGILLWLSTVPPTNGIVATVFGVRYLAMLSGFTFFSHQVGSFLGAWLGGFVFDRTGSYNIVWYLSIALGVVAGLLNLPIDERAIARPKMAEVAA